MTDVTTERQPGFRKQRSFVTQLFEVTQDLTQAEIICHSAVAGHARSDTNRDHLSLSCLRSRKI